MSDEFCGSFGINTKVGFAPSNAIDGAVAAASTRIEILAENLVYSDSVVGGRGITGSINPVTMHLRDGQRLVSGGFVTEIGPVQLAPWIRAICGNSAADQTKETFDLVPHDITVKRDLVTHTYRYCIIQQAMIRCRSNPDDPEDQVMQMAISFLGVEEHSGITFPGALALPSTANPFWIMADSVFDIDSDQFPVISFDLKIQNRLKPLFRNQLKPGCFRCLGRDITLDVKVPYSAAAATAMFGANDTDRAISLEMVSDLLPASAIDYTTTFSLPTCRRVEKRANTRNEDEVPLEATFRSYQDATDSNLIITNATVAP